ncbi:hypothetical protein NIES4071_26550 [Calothrix sp. NIES-4071]|nr:hypothetical protein NIES4071_26550 [Calothrix sp. NIES-4071]BAZ56977.1 hypothetical protein NIES4105_26490 [Calothrix sp. NIES-4105]
MDWYFSKQLFKPLNIKCGDARLLGRLYNLVFYE